MSKKLITTLLVRDELETIKESIYFHLNHGVDFVIVTDNGSKEGTRDFLEDLQKEGIVHLFDESKHNYPQSELVTRMAKIAGEKSAADRILHNDAEHISNTGNNVNNKIILMTNFRTMYPETIETLNQLNKAAEALGYKLLLLSSTFSEKLNCAVIQIPFSLKNWSALNIDPKYRQFYNRDLLEIDAEFNEDSAPDLSNYEAGVWKCSEIARFIAEYIKPAATFLWSSTVPQSIIFKNIFESYFIPSFFTERGLLPDTLMFDNSGSGAYSVLKYFGNNNLSAGSNIFDYEKMKNYYLTSKIEKHYQGESVTKEEYLEKKNISNKKVIFFAGQWDVASGVNRSGDYQSFRNSPVFKNTPDAFQRLSAYTTTKNDVALIFKPHPFDTNNYSENPDKGVFVDRGANIHTLMECADVIAVMNTTVQYEALFYEKPLLLLGNGILNEWNAGYNICGNDKLESVIEDALNRKEYNIKLTNAKSFLSFVSSNYLVALKEETPVETKLFDYLEKLNDKINGNYIPAVDEKRFEMLAERLRELFIKKLNAEEIKEQIEKAEEFIEKNEIIEARKILTEILTIHDPGSVDAANNFAVTEIIAGNYDSAKGLLEQILKINPDFEAASENLKYLNSKVISY